MMGKRRVNIPVTPYVLLILSLVVVLVSGVILINFPSHFKIGYGALASGFTLMALAFLSRPVMLKEVFFSKKTLLWINDIVLVLIIIGIGVVISHIGFRRNMRYDFTRNQLFSLSDQTLTTMRNLEKDVRVHAFYIRGTPEYQLVNDLLEEYKRNSDKFHFTMVDPNRDPVTAKAMNIGSLGTIVVQCETSRRDIFGNDVFEIPPQMAVEAAEPKFKGEQVLTSAIINVVSGVKRLVTFVTGHGEASLYGYRERDLAGVNELLTSENYDMDEVNLMSEEIPDETSLLIIASPQSDFLEDEFDKLRQYLSDRNGHLIVALDPVFETDMLESFILREFGVLANRDVVVDPRGIQKNYWTVAPELGDHPSTNPIRERNIPCMMFHCRSLNVEKRNGYTANEYLKTIEHAWAKRNLSRAGQIDIGFEQGVDRRGPLTLGVSLEQTDMATGSRILIWGDSDFFSNSYIGLLANKDLFVNAVNWAVGQEQMISIRARVFEIPRLVLEEKDSQMIMAISVFGAPVLILLLGGIVFLVRRRV